jgi:tetratricopeptide (TPR) repeat protein
VISEQMFPLLMLGRWDEVAAAVAELTQEQIDSGGLLLSMLQSAVEVSVKRGELEEARRVLGLFTRLEDSTDTQELSSFLACRAELGRAEGNLRQALADGRAAVDAIRKAFGLSAQSGKHGLVQALEAAFDLGDTENVEKLLGMIDTLPPGSRPPYLDAHATRFRARIVGDSDLYEAATTRFRSLGTLFWEAVTQLEHAELLAGQGRADEAGSLAESAQEIFGRLRATPWLERAASLAGGVEVPA